MDFRSEATQLDKEVEVLADLDLETPLQRLQFKFSPPFRLLARADYAATDLVGLLSTWAVDELQAGKAVVYTLQQELLAQTRKTVYKTVYGQYPKNNH